ncbi:MAG: lipoprotein signal peptidase [Bacteroidales bacterium]|nr:lipoprotein signal peptidase [Bacteroidales bacterium]
MNKKQIRISIIIVILALIIDQIVKIIVKTNMTIGESIPVFGNWFQIYFVENNGMAFGWDFFGKSGKIFLSIFRLVAAIGIAFYIRYLIKNKTATVIVVALSLILAGAVGNLIDSVLYGKIFNESTFFETAKLFPENGGYAPLMYGMVVDMLYFPIIDISQESAGWLPDFLVGSDGHFIFFRPIFNIADSCVTIGAFLVLIFAKKLGFEKEKSQKEVVDEM